MSELPSCLPSELRVNRAGKLRPPKVEVKVAAWTLEAGDWRLVGGEARAVLSRCAKGKEGSVLPLQDPNPRGHSKRLRATVAKGLA
jgi:hypothetical protein